MRAEIRTDFTAAIDDEMADDLVGQDRLAEGREARELALVPVPDEAERIGEVGIQEADAVGLVAVEQISLAAEHGFDTAAAANPRTVRNVVADAVCGIDQCIIEFRIEIGRQAVRGVVVVDVELRLAESVAGAKRVLVEQAQGILGARAATHIEQHHQFPPAAQTVISLLDPPAPAQHIGLQLEIRARHAHRVYVAALDARDRKAIVDRRQRQLGVGGNAGIFLARQSLQRDRRDQLVVAKEASRRIVLAVMKTKDVHADVS